MTGTLPELTLRRQCAGRCGTLIPYIVEPGSFAPELHSDGLVAYRDGHLCTGVRVHRGDVARDAAHGDCCGIVRRAARTGHVMAGANLPPSAIACRVAARTAAHASVARICRSTS